MLKKFIVKRLDPQAKLPEKGSKRAAGYDVYANEEAIVKAGKHSMIGTGLAWICPPDTYARIAPRSGLALKHGISVGAGVIDEDYRGQICVILFNHGQSDFVVK